jgi:hypothetical protein
MKEAFEEILLHYNLDIARFSIKPIGSGLVHQTYLIRGSQSFVLQKINTTIFKSPELIAKNIKVCNDYLGEAHPEYLFIGFTPAKNNRPYALVHDEYWRLSPFVDNSFTEDIVENTDLAYEAGKVVGAFSKNLNGINPELFSQTIPDFHNLSFRYEQFKNALKNGLKNRIIFAKDLISKCINQFHLVQTFKELKQHKNVPLRIQHHDTKINNVLFSLSSKKGIAICDLDTIMPGYAISDLGDMIRTYTSSESEESTEWSEVVVRTEYFEALMKGYLSEMKEVLTEDEKIYLFYAGEFLIFMQALRFLSDFLMGDVYYPVKHENHNFNRAKNQLILLEDFQTKRVSLEKIIQKLLKV